MKNFKHYFPFQPEIQASTNSYIELKPIGQLIGKDIALFYQFKTNNDSAYSISLVPDGCFDILFCCSSSKPSAFLWTSPFQRRKQPKFLSNCEYFGVRFFPEQGMIKLKYPMKELLEQQIPLFDVMTGDLSIIEEIAAGKNFDERIRIFKKFLDRTKYEVDYDQKIIDYAIEKIYLSNGVLNINHLSEEIGYSDRYIRKIFEKHIGFSPKQFCQIVKFQNSLDMILKADNPLLLNSKSLPSDNGYYDQSHFIREFKKFVLLTPKQYKEIYKPSIPM
ncbi:AraC-like DNA-binding protein [Anoxybacillus tepidamans]|uniref:AraC-like DNA-binding protein n=1 Tax=Anoxybacteroides tepidamans TaxID=265948 RepID=A0A7W8MTK9_9BACL|nr:AraC family transcriptional regulator [Anoxybacillus tepidamans]MBB5323249.1 AraC-like DNA-binding protein [Anoxybacillus tepidamans]